MAIIRFLFSKNGRISRFDYWAFFISLFILSAIIANSISEARYGYDEIAYNLWMVTAIIYYPVALWSMVMIIIKRWHDRERPGWYAILSFIPIVAIWPFFELGFNRGTVGENKYGPDPTIKNLLRPDLWPKENLDKEV